MATKKKVKLDLTKVNQNAFAVLGEFASAAKSQGFNQKWIDNIVNKARSEKNYDKLLETIQGYVE